MKNYQDFIDWLKATDDTIPIEYLRRPTRGVNKGKAYFTISKSFNEQNEIDGIIVQKTILNPSKLPLKVFEIVITLLTNNRLQHSAYKGKVMKKKQSILLGDPELELDTVEGIVAHKYYNKPVGRLKYFSGCWYMYSC